jgi:hypothetical protein
MNIWNLLQGGSGAAYSRAERHLRSAQLEWESFPASADAAVATARQLLQQGQTSLGLKKVDDCWHFINAAKRYLASARSDPERSMTARVLLIEAKKLPEWRQKGIVELLRDGKLPSSGELREALWLRDDYYENRYHRISMQGEQLRAIVLIATVALGAILAIAGMASTPAARITETPWDWRVLSVVLAFGVLGASFSAARGITVKDLGTLIPELTLSKWITWARTLLGASLGLAGYAFLLTGILNFGGMNLPTAAAVAFAGGFSEQVVLKLIGTVQAKEQK